MSIASTRAFKCIVHVLYCGDLERVLMQAEKLDKMVDYVFFIAAELSVDGLKDAR